MTARIVAIANQKGGVGKTTSTLQFAHAAVEKGLRTLVIDMDGQGNASQKLADTSQLIGDIQSCSHELFNEEAEISITKSNTGIDVIPAQTNDHTLYSMEAAELDKIIIPRNHVAKFREDYDLVLIDCPPSLGRLLMSCLTMADYVITPVAVSGFAVSGVQGLVDVMERIKETVNPEIQLAGIFVNGYNSRSKEDKNSVAQLRENVGDLLFSQVISRRAPIDQAINRAIPVWKIRSGTASAAAKEIRTVAEEMFKRIGL